MRLKLIYIYCYHVSFCLDTPQGSEVTIETQNYNKIKNNKITKPFIQSLQDLWKGLSYIEKSYLAMIIALFLWIGCIIYHIRNPKDEENLKRKVIADRIVELLFNEQNLSTSLSTNNEDTHNEVLNLSDPLLKKKYLDQQVKEMEKQLSTILITKKEAGLIEQKLYTKPTVKEKTTTTELTLDICISKNLSENLKIHTSEEDIDTYGHIIDKIWYLMLEKNFDIVTIFDCLEIIFSQLYIYGQDPTRISDAHFLQETPAIGEWFSKLKVVQGNAEKSMPMNCYSVDEQRMSFIYFVQKFYQKYPGKINRLATKVKNEQLTTKTQGASILDIVTIMRPILMRVFPKVALHQARLFYKSAIDNYKKICKSYMVEILKLLPISGPIDKKIQELQDNPVLIIQSIPTLLESNNILHLLEEVVNKIMDDQYGIICLLENLKLSTDDQTTLAGELNLFIQELVELMKTTNMSKIEDRVKNIIKMLDLTNFFAEVPENPEVIRLILARDVTRTHTLEIKKEELVTIIPSLFNFLSQILFIIVTKINDKNILGQNVLLPAIEALNSKIKK